MKKTVLILLTLGMLLGMTFLGSAYALDPLESTVNTHIWYTYENGILIDQGGTITTKGVDGQGAEYSVTTTLTYDLVNSKPILALSESSTDSSHVDGSNSHSDRTTTYEYDARGILTGASGNSYTTGYGADTLDDDGLEIDGAYYTNNVEQTYDIIGGAAQVVGSTSTQYTYTEPGDDGVVTGESVSTTTYEYEIILGLARLTTITSDSVSQDKQNFDPSGDPATAVQHTVTVYTYNECGSLLEAYSPEESSTGSGTQLGNNGWETYTSTIETRYMISNGIALRSHYYEDKTIVPYDGLALEIQGPVPGESW